MATVKNNIPFHRRFLLFFDLTTQKPNPLTSAACNQYVLVSIFPGPLWAIGTLRYSYRKATSGSTLAARRAGT
jgi:hypothetical protein